MTTYREAGVDLHAARQTKQMIADAVRSTHGPAVLAGMGAFGGALELGHALTDYYAPVLVASTDGVGTKTLIAHATRRYDTVGQDLVNHCINDILVQGARPLFFMDYIAAARLAPEVIATVVGGVATACRQAGCALLGGETAEMPGIYREETFDLAGTIVGIVERSRLIDGHTITVGDVILSLPSTGLHTNGYSLARQICDPLGYDARPVELGGPSLGEALLAVHHSYLTELTMLWEAGVDVKGMAHITGGGLLENLPRILPAGTGARVERGRWSPPPIFMFLIEQARLAVDEAFRVLNMGVGMALVVAGEETARVQALLPQAKQIGMIVAGKGVTLA